MNNYQIISDPVGEGTFGKVFKAKYIGPLDYAEKNHIPKIVALKKIKMDDEKEGFPITALREIMLMKNVSHKNLMQLLEIVTSKPSIKTKNQSVYLVMEYMEHDISGLSLAKFKFTLPQIKYIMYQILQGVQYLHKNEIIHRDIKCANILINNKGDVKIGDFGLARKISTTKKKKYTYRVVTLWFRAPELLFGQTEYGPAIDVWSIGCVFGELLTGICPFQGKNEEMLILKICEKCGTPTELNWPGVTKLPLYNKICPLKEFPYALWDYYKDCKNMDQTTFDLFSRMLILDPQKRITIDEALKHPYFTEKLPKMCSQHEMPDLSNEYHEHEYSRLQKKLKEEQNIAKRDYMNKQNISKFNNGNNNNNQMKSSNNFNNNNNYFLGKKHKPDNNNNNNKNNHDGWD